METTLGISGTHSILHEHLSVKKICSRWTPLNLSIAQKIARLVERNAQKYDRGASKNVYDIVTGDESCIYAHETASKQQSTVWVFQKEPNPTPPCLKYKMRSQHFSTPEEENSIRVVKVLQQLVQRHAKVYRS